MNKSRTTVNKYERAFRFRVHHNG